MISLLRGFCRRFLNRYILQQMSKNLFIFVFALLIVNLTADLPFTRYTSQEIIPLDVNVLSLGYSPDQKHLVLTTGVQGQFMMYEGVRMDKPVTVTIADDQFDVNVASFAFSPDKSMLVIGSKEGSVYGFAIENDKLTTPYKYFKNIGTKGTDLQIYSIGISNKNKVAVAAKNQLFVLQIPTDQSKEFTVLGSHLFVDKTISSVAWKYNDENFVLVGCFGTTGLFTLYDLANDNPKQINTDGTSSIAVFPDGQVYQGRILSDIQTFTWDEAKKEYVPGDVIADTTYATQMKVSTNGEYFGAVVQLNTQSTVLAWRMNPVEALSNLQNLKLSLTAPTQFFNSIGITFALSGNGNELIFIKDTAKTLLRYALCKDGTYYDNENGNENCVACINDCQKCFDDTTCLACPIGWYITVDNKCVTCENVTPGCKTCSDKNTCNACNTIDHWKQPVTKGVCVCEPTYYQAVYQCLLCSDKLDFCQLCTTPTQCTQCYKAGNINPQPRNDKCVCIDGWYFDDKNICQDCKQTITGCIDCDNADKCTLCDEGNKFVSDGKGKCICDTDYWLNPTSNQCQLCSTSVPGCLVCQQDGICIRCSQEKRTPNNDKKECICQPYTYEDQNKICQDCDLHRHCLICDPKPPQQCQVCDIKKNFKENPKDGICVCEKGYTPGDNYQCVECNVPGCQDCDQAHVCDKCLINKNFKPDPQSNVCVCQDNHFVVENLTECWTCGQAMTGCTQCDNLKECTQCDDSLNFELKADTKQCQCKSSFFEQNKECTLCANSFIFCLNCNSTTCQQCQDGFSYNQEQNACFCPEDRDFDRDAGKCEQKAGLSALAIIAIIVGILALAGGAVALIKCCKKRQSPLQDDEYEALEEEKKK